MMNKKKHFNHCEEVKFGDLAPHNGSHTKRNEQWKI